MIQRIGGQTGDAAGEGASGADQTVRGFAVRCSRIRREGPHDAMLGRIGDAQRGNVPVAGGGCG